MMRRKRPLPLFSLKTALGYTVRETSGAVGQCPPRVRASGTLAGKMTQRLHAEAQAGPETLAEWSPHGHHQRSVSQRRQGS